MKKIFFTLLLMNVVVFNTNAQIPKSEYYELYIEADCTTSSPGNVYAIRFDGNKILKRLVPLNELRNAARENKDFRLNFYVVSNGAYFTNDLWESYSYVYDSSLSTDNYVVYRKDDRLLQNGFNFQQYYEHIGYSYVAITRDKKEVITWSTRNTSSEIMWKTYFKRVYVNDFKPKAVTPDFL